MRKPYDYNRDCYTAILAVPWNGLKPCSPVEIDSSVRPEHRPPQLVDTPPWPFRHPAYPAPYSWTFNARVEDVFALLPDHSMNRPVAWAPINEDVRSVEVDGKWVKVLRQEDDVWTKKTKPELDRWLAAVVAVMRRKYATHAQCYAAVKRVKWNKDFQVVPWPFRHPEYPAPFGWSWGVDTVLGHIPPSARLIPDYSVDRPAEWGGVGA